jgi:transposase
MKGRRRERKEQESGSRTRRKFTREFKVEAVRLATVGDRPVSEVARELGVRPETLYQWRQVVALHAGQSAPDIFPGNGKLTSQDEEIRRLRRENTVLREERDILGKATAFFSRHTR